MITELYHIYLINLDLELTSFKTGWNFQYIFKQFFLWKKERFHCRFCGTSVAQMIEHSTGNRKVLGSIPSGVEAFLFSQKKLFKNGRYCLIAVLSLYFYFWYIKDDFTKKNEFFLPKSDRLIHLLISIVNNKCKYPWLYFPLIEASFSQRKKTWWEELSGSNI